jgi:hypothetical protein
MVFFIKSLHNIELGLVVSDFQYGFSLQTEMPSRHTLEHVHQFFRLAHQQRPAAAA